MANDPPTRHLPALWRVDAACRPDARRDREWAFEWCVFLQKLQPKENIRMTTTTTTRAHEAVRRAIRDAPCPDGDAPTTDRVLARASGHGTRLTRGEAVTALEDLAANDAIHAVEGRWRVFR